MSDVRAPTIPAGFAALPCHSFVSGEGRRLHVYGALHGRPGPDWPRRETGKLHRRFDMLSGAWVAITPARNVRPRVTDRTRAEAGCPLCPGAPEVPFAYEAAVFDNRYPALVPDPPQPPAGAGYGPARGHCEVVLYTGAHHASVASLTPVDLARVLAVWRDRTTELWASAGHAFVMAFENRGEAVGTTLSHPHGQVYAVDHQPPFIAARVAALTNERRRHGRCVSCATVERDVEQRLVLPNPHFAVAVPFAARWPYEVHVRARRHGLRRLADLLPDEQRALAAALRGLVRRYDRLFGFELPYLMTIMEAPAGADDWHLAVEFQPPHRAERLLKIRASVETATGLFLNDTLPEASAARLAAIDVPTEAEAPPFFAEECGVEVIA
jgi:UDPglucose--hexose-1-phosphate uridylyltransferase